MAVELSKMAEVHGIVKSCRDLLYTVAYKDKLPP
jgi:hypothetical protein